MPYVEDRAKPIPPLLAVAFRREEGGIKGGFAAEGDDTGPQALVHAMDRAATTA